MAGSLFVLLDDISTTLDDVAAMTKVAAKKTSGVLGDDLALNAEQVSGVKAERELPIVWGVAKGSFVNKAILVPVALGLSAFAPGAIIPILGIGGLYLCYEGVEAVMEKVFHKEEHHSHNNIFERKEPSAEEEKKIEKEKIKGAVKTDFILSGEIIVIALGSFSHQPFVTQAIALSSVAVAMTAGVYGAVAGIVKMDDIGLWLHDLNKDNFKNKMKDLSESSKKHSMFLKPITYPFTKALSFIGNNLFNNDSGIKFLNKFGKGTVNFMPKLMKGLSTVGTAAMFTVGGGILAHTLNHFGFEQIHHLTEGLNGLVTMGIEGALGVAIGSVAVGAMHVKDKIVSLISPEKPSVEKENKPSYHQEPHHDKKHEHNFQHDYHKAHQLKNTKVHEVVETNTVEPVEAKDTVEQQEPNKGSAFVKIAENTNIMKNDKSTQLKM